MQHKKLSTYQQKEQRKKEPKKETRKITTTNFCQPFLGRDRMMNDYTNSFK